VNTRPVACAGLALGVRQSGKKTVHGRITKERNRLVRWVMVQAAQNARLHDDRFREFYERNSRRKGHQKAIVAVAHVGDVIFHCESLKGWSV